MKEVIMYKCEDGSLFNDKEKAEERDKLIEKVKNALSSMKPREAIDKYAGKVDIAIRQNKDDVIYAMCKFIDVCKETFTGKYDKELLEKYKNSYRNQDDSVHISHIERLFSDYGIEIFKNTLYRFRCISTKTFIEYPNVFYSTQPNLFDGKIINEEKEISENDI